MAEDEAVNIEHSQAPASTTTELAGSDAAPSPRRRAKRNPKRKTTLKDAASAWGYTAAGIRHWIAVENAPGEQDAKGKWWVDLEELHHWAISKGKKVPTKAPTLFVAPESDAEPTDSVEQAEMEFDPSFVAQSRPELLARAQNQLAFMLARLDRMSRATNLDTGGLQRLGQTIKSLSEEIRQLEKADLRSAIDDGDLIPREDVEASVASMASAWLDGLSQTESSVITSIGRVLDEAESAGLDREHRARVVEQAVASGFLSMREAIAAAIRESARPVKPASEEAAACA